MDTRQESTNPASGQPTTDQEVHQAGSLHNEAPKPTGDLSSLFESMTHPGRQGTPGSLIPPMPEEAPDAPTVGEIREALDDLLHQPETEVPVATDEAETEPVTSAIEQVVPEVVTTEHATEETAESTESNGPFESTTLDLLASSHAGDTLYNLYKWKEQADRDFHESGDLKLAVQTEEEHSVAEGNMPRVHVDFERTVPSEENPSVAIDPSLLTSDANYHIGTRRNSDPGPAAADAYTAEPSDFESLQMPGGMRRHYVMQEHMEQTGTEVFPKNERKLWTDSFMHFLTMYGHTMIIQSSLDEDDTEDESDASESESHTTMRRRRAEHLDRMEQGLMAKTVTHKSRRLQSYEQLVKQKKLSPLHHHHHHNQSHGIQTSHPSVPLNSDSKAFFILLKSFIGAGILYVPHAFVRAGMATSFILILVIALFSYYGMYLLIEAKNRLRGDHTFATIGRATFGSIECKWLGLRGHNFYLGESVRAVVEAALAVSQIGFAASSVIFIANNLDELIRFYLQKEVDIALLIFAQLAFYLPISLTRRIQKLSVLAIIADVMILVGVVTVIYFDVKVLSTGAIASIKAFATSGAPQMVGTVVFSFEGIGLIIPIQSSMQNPKQFPKLLAYVVAIISGLLMLLSTLSYLAFGEQVQTIIWDSFPRDTVAHRNLIGFARIGYIIAILFTFPLLVLPATRILEGRISRWEIRKGQRASGKDKRRVKWTKNMIRWISCVITCAIAYACGSQLGNFVSLIGAVCCIPLLYILPPAFHAVMARNRFELYTDLLVICIGICTMVYVTMVTLQNWSSGGGGH